MPWQRMMFRNDTVWVLVDEASRPVLGPDGRAEMKYRENDSKSYRPAASNLTPMSDEPSAAPRLSASDRPRPATPRARPASARSTAPAARSAAAAGSSGHPPLEVWTDGACSGNPGPMALGVVVIDGKERHELGEYLGVGTNNIAELTAIERGLELAATRLGKTPGRRVRIYTDSGYSIGVLDKAWKAKANQELVARLRRQLSDHPGTIEFVKVPGHAGVPENERCDALARAAIAKRGRVG
jgi:ribonuclease HI